MKQEADIFKRMDELEKKMDTLHKTLNCLIDCINSYDAHVKEICVIWKREVKEKLNLTNTDVGLPKIDDEAIVVMSKQHITVPVIAQKLGCSESAIVKRRKKLREQGRL